MLVAAQKPATDRETDKLKGKVKTVAASQTIYAYPYYKGDLPVDVNNLPELKHLPEEIVTYDEKGNRVQRDVYSSSDVLLGIEQYAFLDGKRIIKIIAKVKPPWMPKVMMPPIPGVTDRPRDERYTYRFEYKYDANGRRIEDRRYDNRDLLERRIVRKYDAKGNEIERLEIFIQYSARREPPMYEEPPLRDVYFYDARGNETEKAHYVPVFKTPTMEYDGIKPIQRTLYSKYEFDSHGNWTKRIAEWRALDLMGGTRNEVKTIVVEQRIIKYF